MVETRLGPIHIIVQCMCTLREDLGEFAYAMQKRGGVENMTTVIT